MFEAALIILVATGSLWMLSRQMNNTTSKVKQPDTNEWGEQLLTPIAGGGLYAISKIGEQAKYVAFSDLQLIRGGMALRDSKDGHLRVIHFSVVQWVSAMTLADDGTADITVHIEADQQWRLLQLRLVESDMAVLVKVLKRSLPAARLNIGRPASKPIGPVPARLISENLQGEITVGAEVALYVLPHMLIVLHDDTVQAKLDTSSIRRILAVERVSGKFDSLLNRNTPDGIIRLYSLHETAVFALPQYRELAEELSYLSRCPVEFIVQDDKTQKL